MPVAGEVTDSNKTLDGAAEKVSEAPETNGWLIKVKYQDGTPLDEMMDQAGYEKYLKDTADQH